MLVGVIIGVILPECYSCIIFFASVSGYLDLSGPYFNIARCSSMGMGLVSDGENNLYTGKLI